MRAAAARDVSSQSPPPPSDHDRHLSITDSIVSTTVEELKERYRLSTNGHTPAAPHPPHLRRDSMFSFNTQWTGDEAFSISDFPRPPAAIPRFGPAIPSSA
ncbi:hypothetical protein FRC11_010360, partial [Ceratobasidium sp. 423]